MKVRLLFVSFVVFCRAKNNCDVAVDKRQDCGFSGINQQQCEGIGCCWVPVNLLNGVDGVPWCFLVVINLPHRNQLRHLVVNVMLI
eukprot:UN11846